MLNLPEEEKKILDFWEKEHIFQKSLDARKKGKPFVFYEGPPTANGKPGLHHVLARAYKDIILRYKTMRGFFVARKAGWDTHGLPVELEVEKALGINSKKGIEEYGIGAFIAQAKESVWTYKKEWEELTRRMGFWLDLTHPYITYETSYIETLWFIIKTFWDKKLLEQDFKVVPWCPRCGTPLSSHEVAQGYQKVSDTALYVKFKIQSEKLKVAVQSSKLSEVYILAWTTTPWTLPGNVALAVGEEIDYVIIKLNPKPSTLNPTEFYILAKGRLEIIKNDYEIIQELKGKHLVGLSYEPLFDVPQLKSETSYKIYAADFVSTDEGTGVVHTAVMYGEDDYQLGKEIGLPMVHTVREDGTFVEGLGSNLGGRHVKAKETEEIIANHLRKKGLLFANENYSHEYPFCWRCKNPLLYYATKTWFVKVTNVKKELIANNQTISWRPEYLKNGRFGNFLQEVKDWAFSRERYWGTPLPIWQCVQCKHTEVVGGIAELSNRVKPRNTFILARHGQSENNLTHTLSCMPEQKEYALTQKGKSQAQCLGELLAPESIDYIIASPLARTAQTATIISKITGAHVFLDTRLREVDFGPFNGKTLKEYETFWGSKEGKFSKQAPQGMENFHDLKARIVECISDINKKYEGKTILIVTHKGPLWVAEGTLRGLREQQIAREFPEDFESGEARKVYITLPFNNEGEIDLHRPFIDELALTCETCQGSMKRIPAVADVWFDSGAMPFAQAHWPFAFATNDRRKSLVVSRKLGTLAFPADYICEAIDQTRGWFYTLLAVSTLLGFGAPYKNVISLGHLLDEKGRKMSKSLGNIIDPFSAIEQYGVDAIRWFFYVVNPPGMYKRFDPKEVLSHQRRFLLTLANSANFLRLALGGHQSKAKALVKKLSKTPPAHALDIWILSLLHKTIAQVTQDLEAYRVTRAARGLEDFVDDFSNWYIRRSRERLQGQDAPMVIAVLSIVLRDMAKMMAPFTPFSADTLVREYLNPLGVIDSIKSVHLELWPESNSSFINPVLEEQMKKARHYVLLALAQRAKEGIKVRQPLSRLTIQENLPEEIQELIAQEVNVKKVISDTSLSAHIALDTAIDRALREEGFIREFIRNVQDVRKQANLKAGEPARLIVEASQEMRHILQSAVADNLEARLFVTFIFAQVTTPLQKVLNIDDKEVKIGIIT